MKRPVLMLFAVSLVLLAMSSTAHAVKPFSFSGSGGGQVPLGYCAEQGFEVWEDATWEFRGKAFFDKDGNLVRVQRHWRVDGQVYNVDHPELFLEYKNSVYNEVWDPESGETRYTGLWALITLPGYGSIFIDVGLVLLDEDFNVIFEAGQHQWWNANVDELCEHLTP
jgi:hypothetical protein